MNIERLEARIAPATLNPAGTILTYTDIDGDAVKITFNTNITITAKRTDSNSDGVLDGDGVANVGYINGSDHSRQRERIGRSREARRRHR